MKSKLIQFFAAQVLAWLYGLTAQDLEDAKRYVKEAEEEFEDAPVAERTAKKWLFVKQRLQTLWPHIAAAGVNLAIELAVSFLKKKA